MADVPPQVNYGFITGRFVQFVADSGDANDRPDEIPLTGTATLTPTVTLMRFPTTTPPRTAVVTRVICKIVDGNLLAPDGSTKLAVIASDQPDGDPTFVQWMVDIRLDAVTTQPAPITINVPTGGTIDLTTVIPAPPEPPTITIVSSDDRERAEAAAGDASIFATNAEASAVRAEAAADTAAQDAADAVLDLTGADVTAAEAAATAAQGSATAAATSAASAQQALTDMPDWWFGTQAAYDAITTKDPNTLYAITG
jgi:hypothetical protein